jgi:hypothetical protein
MLSLTEHEKKNKLARQAPVTYHVSSADAEVCQDGRPRVAPFPRLAPGELFVAEDDGRAVAEHERGALQEAQRRKRHVVRRAPSRAFHGSVYAKWRDGSPEA